MGRPVLIVCNHTSFFDILLLVTLLPYSKARRVKMFISHNLFKIPIIGCIVSAMGHLAIPFNNTDPPEKRALQKQVMAERMELFEAYVRSGGYGGWFPEGRLNFKNTHQLNQFKKGGFAPAVDIDVELWVVSFVGNAVTWHGKGCPGKPARIGASISCLCQSTRDYIGNATGADVTKDIKMEYLANEAQAKCQEGISAFVREGFVGHYS